MKKKQIWAIVPLLLLGSLTVTGCSLFNGNNNNNNTSDDDNNNNNNNDNDDGDDGDETEVNWDKIDSLSDDNSNSGAALINSEEYKTFWKTSTNLNFKITMSNDVAYNISKYQSDSSKVYNDYYFPCNVEYTIGDTTYTMEEVGIRMKGNTSRHEYVSSDGNFYDGDEGNVHFKLKFGETFDGDEYTTIDFLKPYYHDWSSDKTAKKTRKARNIGGMEKLNLKWNKNYDGTRSKQSYAYSLFRKAGVLAPHSSLTTVTVATAADSINGVYEVLEEVDEVLISRYFSEEHATGDLYKCGWTNSGAYFGSDSSIGVEDCANGLFYNYDLKTNKKKSTHAALNNFISVVNDTTTSAANYKEKLENVLDVKSFLMEEACAYLIGNPDDMRNNMNNYYVYFDSVTNKATIIPYDFDRCLGIGVDWNPDGNWLKTVYPTSSKMKGNGSNDQKNNLFYRTIISGTNRVSDYYNYYKQYIETLVNNEYISTSSFNTYVNSFPSSYRGSTTEPDSRSNKTTDDNKYNISFDEYFSAKVETLKSSSVGYSIIK